MPPLPDPDRDSSEDSGDEPNPKLYALTFNAEKVALKVLNKNILADEDSWPIYVLEDATIFAKDGVFADSDVSVNCKSHDQAQIEDTGD